MAKTYTDQIYSGTLGTSETTVVTVAANTTFILKGMWLSNANSSNAIALIKINDKRFMPNISVPYNDTIVQDNLQIPIQTGGTIKVSSDTANVVDYYIWGVNEVTS